MYCLKNIICGVTGVLLLSVSYAQDIGSVSGQKAFTLHGNFNAGLNYHTDLSDKNSSSPISFGPSPSYFLQFNPVLTIYGMALPFNLMFASQNKSFNTPFNRYGASPYYKWVKLHLGWRSLHFSQFTLGGQQMLGAGFELTPGKFRAAFMYGKFNNAVTDISLYNNLNSNLQSDKVMALLQDSHGNIWAGTFGGGLALFNKDKQQFNNYSEKDGLANNNVYKILEDSDGKLWVSTNLGISCLDLATKKFSNYNLHNGLQPSNFSRGSGMLAKDGQLYFGGLQ